jgi:hypothetical protein
MRTYSMKWSKIARAMAGRNENMVKNRYNSLLRKLRKSAYASAYSEDISE